MGNGHAGSAAAVVVVCGWTEYQLNFDFIKQVNVVGHEWISCMPVLVVVVSGAFIKVN